MAVVRHQGGIRESAGERLPSAGDIDVPRSCLARVSKHSRTLTAYVLREPGILDFAGCRHGCGERLFRAVVLAHPDGRVPQDRELFHTIRHVVDVECGGQRFRERLVPSELCPILVDGVIRRRREFWFRRSAYRL